MTRRHLALSSCLQLAFGAACGHASPPPPPAEPVEERAPAAIDLVLTAATLLNPDAQGRSLPTLVRVYQLKAASKLEAAEYDQLYRSPKETLGDDLLQADELVLSPGETAHRRLDRNRAARVLAVVPVVRQPSGSSYRASVELPSPREPAALTFLVEGYRIERRR